MNKKLAIVGFSPSSRDQSPWDDPEYDIWICNRGWAQNWMKRWDVLFELHPLEYLKLSLGNSTPEREHWEWLIQKHDKPIYMQEVFPDVPDSVKYPIERMRKRYGDFYTSTIAYMMALGIDMGYEHIGIWGVDMSADTEYNYQRDSMEYFLGIAIGKGIDVYLPKECPLLTGRIYAFGDNSIGYRQRLEFRRGMLQKQLDGAIGDYHKYLGYVQTIEKVLPQYPDAKSLLESGNDLHLESRDVCQMVNGAIQEVDEMLKYFDEFYNVSGGIDIHGKKHEENLTGTERDTKQTD